MIFMANVVKDYFFFKGFYCFYIYVKTHGL